MREFSRVVQGPGLFSHGGVPGFFGDCGPNCRPHGAPLHTPETRRLAAPGLISVSFRYAMMSGAADWGSSILEEHLGTRHQGARVSSAHWSNLGLIPNDFPDFLSAGE